MTRPCEIEEVKGGEWQTWSPRRQRGFIQAAVRYWRARGFPYYRLSSEQIAREAAALLRCRSEVLMKGNFILSTTTGLRLANFFHPQMWHVRCTRYKSPRETFQDDIKLASAIERALRIWPDRCGARATCLRRMLKSFSNTVGVSNFRPTAAKTLISRYCPQRGQILDFSAGYGGRLLGAMALNRSYVGIDPARAQVSGLRTMIRQLRLPFAYTAMARIIRGPAERVLKTLRKSSFDMVLSSPPYFDRERYSFEEGQSFRRFASFDLWKDGFLKVAIVESSRLLKPGGFFVINVHNNCEPLAKTVRSLAPWDLQFCREWHMQLARLPYKRKSAADVYKTEPVLVFQKGQ